MAQTSEHPHPADLPADQARQGKELGTVRWVLRISMGPAVLAGLIIYFSYADFFHA